MTMTPEEEYLFIKKEVDYTAKLEQEKFQELKIAEKRWREAEFRYQITYKALCDFCEANPDILAKQENNNDNTN